MLSHCRARPYIWPLVLRQPIKVLWVRRRNILRTLVSRRAAESSGVYHVSETLKSDSAVKSWVPMEIHLETKSLLRDLESIESEDADWRERLAELEGVLEIVYEDYLSDTTAWNDRILGFIDVSQCELRSDLKRVNPTELGRMISNYEGVRTVLKNTRFGKFLES